jgi:hypothetical protein
MLDRNPGKVRWQDRFGTATAAIHITVMVTVVMLANALQFAAELSELPHGDAGEPIEVGDLTGEQVRSVVEDTIGRYGSTIQPEERPSAQVITAIERAFGYLPSST